MASASVCARSSTPRRRPKTLIFPYPSVDPQRPARHTPPVEEQDSAAARGPEHASDLPAQPPLEARESSAPSEAAPEHGYSETQPAEGGAPTSGSASSSGDRPRGEGGYSRYRERGGRGRGGRGRRPQRGRRGTGGGGDYDRPPREDYPR